MENKIRTERNLEKSIRKENLTAILCEKEALLMIRKATEKDVDTVAKLYEELHADHDSHPNYCNWDRRIYPVRQTAEKAFRGGWLYVYENDAADYSDGQNENINENSEVSPQILGAVILNHIQPQEYAGMAWNIEAEAEDVFVIHTLCVSPRARKMGIGKQFVAFAEQLGKELGCKAMRFDTSEFNKPAYTLYTSQGYAVVGKTLVQTSERMMEILYCFDKKL